MMKYSFGYVLLLACGFVVPALSQEDDTPIKAKDFKCQLMPVLKTSPSRLYPDVCTLKHPAFICGGYCHSSHEPAKVKKIKDNSHGSEPTWEIRLKEDCNCCLPITDTSTDSAATVHWPLNCPNDGETRNKTEEITIQFPASCECIDCTSHSGL